MKNQKWLLLLVALALMAGTAGALVRLKSYQQLGKPGIGATPIAGQPDDESGFAGARAGFHFHQRAGTGDGARVICRRTPATRERHYQSPDGFDITGTVVLMGADRTSIHKPDYCLRGAGLEHPLEKKS